jgi:uncharacterized membrane protein YccF (DUF307 family)
MRFDRIMPPEYGDLTAWAQQGVLLLWCITVIGIPLGLANFKLFPISLFPLGQDIVSTDTFDAAFANGVVIEPPA